MSDLIGKTLGPYRILEQIGVGGMATVYKAYQPSMDRDVAIKILPHYLSQDAEFAKRFQREARAIAKLEHAHILPVYDYGEHDQITYIAMRYVQAGTLKERIARGPLPLDEINRLIGQIGGALDYAHRMGVIHRDVKPGNVLVDAQGDTYLTDFGLARMMEATQQLTASGVGLGTPAYMSPEQGQGVKVDHRSDIYSLGVILFEMVTGHVPFEAETPMAVVLKHITDPLPLPRAIAPDVPEAVERVILKALAKNPTDRFQTAGEMAQALAVAVRKASTEPAGQPVPAPARPTPDHEDVSLITRVQQVWEKPRGKAALVGGVVFIVVALGFLLSRLPGNVAIVRPGATREVATEATAIRAQATNKTAQPTILPTVTAVAATVPEPSVSQPTAQATSVPGEYLLSDSFDDPAYDGKYNTNLWTCGGCAFGDVTVAQGDNSVGLEINKGSGGLQSQSPWPSDQIGYLQGRLKLQNTDSGGVNLLLRTTLGSGAWETSCFTQRISTTQAEYTCDVYTFANGQFRGEYGTESFPVSYDEWHTARIELRPNTLELRFYFDGKLIGQHTPVDANELKTKSLRVFFGVYTDTHLVARIDDVLVGITQPTEALSPLAEQARAFAEPILAAIANRAPDYDDDFSDPGSGWPSGLTPSGDAWGYEDNAYFISATCLPQTGRAGECHAGSAPDRALRFSDFVLEVDAQFISGEWGSWYILFRDSPGTIERPTSIHYGVQFDPGGAGRIYKNVGGTDISLNALTFEQSGTNRLMIIARGPQIAVYVNGEPLGLFYDESSSKGTIHLGIGNQVENTTLRVHFDNLKIWDISDLP